jgi:hypothetical protein
VGVDPSDLKPNMLLAVSFQDISGGFTIAQFCPPA